MTVTGFELTEWAAERCGYTSSRNIYVLTDSASAFMSFDAGKGAGYKTAEFLAAIHGYNTWQVDDAHLLSKNTLFRQRNRLDICGGYNMRQR